MSKTNIYNWKNLIFISLFAALLAACSGDGNQWVNINSDGISGSYCDDNTCIGGTTNNNSSNNGSGGQNQVSNNYSDTVSGKALIEHSEFQKEGSTGWTIYDWQLSNLGSIDPQAKDLSSLKITSGNTTYDVREPKQGDNKFVQYGSIIGNIVDLGNEREISNTWGTNLSYARYGLIYADTDPNQDPNAKYDVFYSMFHQGYLTDASSMPSSGVVNYRGEAVVWNGQTGVDATGYSQNANFSANFSSKEFTGNISNIVSFEGNKPMPDMSLAGSIEGNRITGQDAAGTVIDGGFYGPNAAEVSGAFVNQEQKFEGAFGAKRQ